MSTSVQAAAPRQMSVTIEDARALAQRLLARGITSLSTAVPAEKSDLKMAGRLLLLLLEDYRKQTALAVDGD
jgi:hypothetical protein